MNPAINQTIAHDNTLIWAIICSILLHGLLVLVIPNIKLNAVKKPDILEVALAKKPGPPPVVPPEPVLPLPELVKPRAKPLPRPVVEKNEPTVTSPPPAATPTEVIAVTPKPDEIPATHVVPVQEPVKLETPPPAPNLTDINDAKGQYGNSLWGAISKQKRYPKIAQMRGWQGETTIELQLDGNGKLKSKKIIQSSGYEILDKQALEMVEKALPFPAPPEALRGLNFTITVPIPFKLK